MRHLQRPRGAGMCRFGLRYRDLPKFLPRRMDRVAGVAIGLATLDLLFAAQKFVDVLPPVMQMNVQVP
jgi:hypothetical protein